MKKYLSAIALLLTYCCVNTQVYGTYTILRDASNLSRGTLDPYRVNSDTFTMRGHMDGLINGITTTTVQIDNLTTSTNSLKTEINLVRVATGSYAVTVYTDTSTLQTNIALVGVSTKTLADIVRVDTTTLQSRINQLATDTGTIKTEINLVRVATGSYAITVYTDTTTLQGRISQIATDTGTVRTDIALIGVSTKTLADAVGVATGSLAVAVYTDTTTLRSRINQLSIDTGTVKNTVALDTATLLSMVTFTNNATSTAGVKDVAFLTYESTADAQQTKFVNFRTTTDAAIPTADLNYKIYTVYLATSGAPTGNSDIQGSFTTNYHKALEIFQSAGIGEASTSTIRGTLFMGRGEYYWNQGTTVPSNVSLICSDSTTIHANFSGPFIFVWGNMENCNLDLASYGGGYSNKFLNIMSSSTGNNVRLYGGGGNDQTGNNVTMIMASDINNAKWRNISVDGWAGAVQDATRNGGLLTFYRSTDTAIGFDIVKQGTLGTTGKQCIGFGENVRSSLTANDIILGARGVDFHSNSGNEGGYDNRISFKRLRYNYGGAPAAPFYFECYNTGTGGCYSTGTAIVDTYLENTTASTSMFNWVVSGQAKSIGLLIDNLTFVQNYAGAVTVLNMSSEAWMTRFQNSRLYSRLGTVTACADAGTGNDCTGNMVLKDNKEQ